MRRINIVLAFAFFFVSRCPAQQTSATNPAKPSIGIDGPIIGGDGTTNYIAIWAKPNYLLSSVIYQSSAGNVGVGTTSPTAKLDVHGNVNAATTYGISGSTVLTIANPADNNLFTGVGAGFNNVAGQGLGNTFSGYYAGYSNNTGSGNAFMGGFAGLNNTNGIDNVFLGFAAGESNTGGTGNVFTGYDAGQRNTTGNYNVFLGLIAGESNTAGYGNTFTGYSSGQSNTTGMGDAFLGYEAGAGNTTGEFNSFFGFGAGAHNTLGSSDVYIANLGPSSGTESNTIRIGMQGTGTAQQNATYIAGIYGVNVGGIPVQINSNGQLGAQTSSLRFKEQVRDMGDTTNDLMKLRPVTFFYKPQYDDGSHALQYGLIAEEVAKVYPDLVAYDNDGQPYSVRYQYLTTMLLNEAQKQYQRAQAEAEVITSQEQRIEQLEWRLSRLEGLVRSQAQTVARERE